MKPRIVMALALAFFACGEAPQPAPFVLGGSTGNATLSGNVDGLSLVAQDAVTQPWSLVGTTVEMSDHTGLCSLMAANDAAKSSSGLSITFVATDASGAIMSWPPAGTYSIISTTDAIATALRSPNSMVATASFSADDAQCKASAGEAATGGSVILAATPEAGAITGLFEIAFGSGGSAGTLSGTFNAGSCTIPATAVPGSGCE